MKNKFDHIILLGRPAGGKSEFIDFIKDPSDADRVDKYHIGPFESVDDFVWLWEKFLEDDIWEKIGYPRIYSIKDAENRGLSAEGAPLLDFCMERFNVEVQKKYLSRPEFYSEKTLFIEFSRGGSRAYRDALSRLSKEILGKAAILYIRVSYQESWRRNIARYEEKLKHSILAHMCLKPTMEMYYKTDDWDEYTGGKDSGALDINGVSVPFVTVFNEPESTDPVVLDRRYGPQLNKLWELYHAK